MAGILDLFRGGGIKAVDIRRGCYDMATADGVNAEITMYGEIVEAVPLDWWTGEPVPGDYIVLNEFLEDLGKISGARSITIRMNSVGGEVYAALPMYNRLDELKAEITVIVDGVAMSAASFIMCVADTVKVNAASLVMIHKASVHVSGGFNADGLEEMKSLLDTVDKALVSAYVKKTGKGEDEILSMMSKTTYMTGREAVDKGFADELVEGEKPSIAASADGGTLFVDGRAVRLPRNFHDIPEGIPKVNPAAAGAAPDSTNNSQPAPAGGKEGETKMTLDEFKKDHPDLASAIYAEASAAASAELENAVGAAVKGERGRLKEIDEVSALFSDEIVNEAKYGEKPCTAKDLTYQAAQKAAKEGTRFMADLAADNKASGAQGVGAAPSGGDGDAKDAPDDVKAAGKAAARKYNETMGGKKGE